MDARGKFGEHERSVGFQDSRIPGFQDSKIPGFWYSRIMGFGFLILVPRFQKINRVPR